MVGLASPVRAAISWFASQRSRGPKQRSTSRPRPSAPTNLRSGGRATSVFSVLRRTRGTKRGFAWRNDGRKGAGVTQSSSGAGHHHHLPHHLALEKPHHRSGRLGEREALAHGGFDPALSEPRGELPAVPPLALRIALRPLPPVDAYQRSFLEQYKI